MRNIYPSFQSFSRDLLLFGFHCVDVQEGEVLQSWPKKKTTEQTQHQNQQKIEPIPNKKKLLFFK